MLPLKAKIKVQKGEINTKHDYENVVKTKKSTEEIEQIHPLDTECNYFTLSTIDQKTSD